MHHPHLEVHVTQGMASQFLASWINHLQAADVLYKLSLIQAGAALEHASTPSCCRRHRPRARRSVKKRDPGATPRHGVGNRRRWRGATAQTHRCYVKVHMPNTRDTRSKAAALLGLLGVQPLAVSSMQELGSKDLT
jgi:hypothetical protein